MFKFSLAIPPSLFGKKGAKLPKPTSGHHLIFSATFNLVGISFCHLATLELSAAAPPAGCAGTASNPACCRTGTAGRYSQFWLGGGGQKPVSVGRQDHRGDTHTPDRQQHHTALVTVSILYTIQLKRVLQNGGSVLLVNFVEN